MRKNQREIFLESEGDAWFERNQAVIRERDFGKSDRIVKAIDSCLDSSSLQAGAGKLLEVGCGDGKRLHWISENLGLQCYGVDPSEKAVAIAKTTRVHAFQGTADQLNFDDRTFDFLVFGFCLYLCDRDDLFQIANEAHRVLKDEGWLVIHDFYSVAPVAREYPRPGLFSYKMDYRRLFEWHPDYTCVTHSVGSHVGNSYADDPEEWVATSVIRKRRHDE